VADFIWRAVQQAVISRGMYDMSSLYKYCPVYDPENLEKEYSIINLLNNQVTFSTRGNFNDLFDSKINFIKPKKSELKAIYSSLQGQEKHKFKGMFLGENGKSNIDNFHRIVNEQFDEFLIFCLAETQDNNLMWSHYANSHKGFCLEWDASKFNAEKVTYQKNIAKFELLNVIKSQFGLGNEVEDGVKIWEALKVKLIEWKYEGEYRFQLGNGMRDLIKTRNDKFALVSYDPNWIKAIIFGCRMDKRAISYLLERIPKHLQVKYAFEEESKIGIR
jgi:hypothetical protein